MTWGLHPHVFVRPFFKLQNANVKLDLLDLRDLLWKPYRFSLASCSRKLIFFALILPLRYIPAIYSLVSADGVLNTRTKSRVELRHRQLAFNLCGRLNNM